MRIRHLDPSAGSRGSANQPPLSARA
jgi:hypothetical protein